MEKNIHIYKLAKSMSEADYIGYYYSELLRIKNSLLKGNFYAGVQSVSKSGMSRIVKLGYTYKNKFRSITDPKILSLACCDKNGRISGCGMDMLFHAQYSLFHSLHSNYKRANYQKRMKPYNQI